MRDEIKVDQPVTVNKGKMRKSHISGLVKSNMELPLNKTDSKQLGEMDINASNQPEEV